MLLTAVAAAVAVIAVPSNQDARVLAVDARVTFRALRSSADRSDENIQLNLLSFS